MTWSLEFLTKIGRKSLANTRRKRRRAAARAANLVLHELGLAGTYRFSVWVARPD